MLSLLEIFAFKLRKFPRYARLNTSTSFRRLCGWSVRCLRGVLHSVWAMRVGIGWDGNLLVVICLLEIVHSRDNSPVPVYSRLCIWMDWCGSGLVGSSGILWWRCGTCRCHMGMGLMGEADSDSWLLVSVCEVGMIGM